MLRADTSRIGSRGINSPDSLGQHQPEMCIRDSVASALIYRNCIAPQTVLLLVVKNPAKVTDGADWLWAKSGKFAAGN